MDKEFRFYLDGVELNHDIFNFNDIEFVSVRNSTYWGYFRNAAISSLTFVNKDAEKVKNIFYNGNLNTDTVFRIDTINKIFNTYELFQEGLLTFKDYEEYINENNKLTVTVGFANSSEQEKLKNRSGNELIIGNNKSVENKDVDSISLKDITYNRKVFKNEANYTFSSLLQSTDFFPGSDSSLTYYYDGTNSSIKYTGDISIDAQKRAYGSSSARAVYGGTTNFGSPEVASFAGTVFNYVHLGLGITTSNTGFAKSSFATNYNAYTPFINLNGNQVLKLTGNDYEPTDGNMFFIPTGIDRSIDFSGTIDLNVTWRHREIGHDIEVGIQSELCEFRKTNSSLNYYDIVNVLQTDVSPTHFLNPGTTFDPNSTDTTLPIKYSVQNINIPISLIHDLPKDAALGIRTTRIIYSASSPSARDIVSLFEDNGTDLQLFYFDEDEEYPTTTSKSQLIYEALDSLLSQITDVNGILKSNFFGRTDNGYSVDGEGSLLAITSGFLIRNAINSDNSPINLTLNFTNLYKTLTSLYGLGLYWDGVNINIEKRSEMFGNVLIELSPNDINTSILSELIYTSVEVGNDKIMYQDIMQINIYKT